MPIIRRVDPSLLEQLVAADEHCGLPRRRSLSPDRDTATSLRRLGERIVPGLPDGLARAIVAGLCRTAELMLAEFPHNLFWDLDLLAATLARQAREPIRAHERIEETIALLDAVHVTFGLRSAIRFRYTHDFLYGYDWARWMGRRPADAPFVGPYDAEFLRYVVARGTELERLVTSGTDALYRELPQGEFRNPFPFDRSPDHEVRLHDELARASLVPVPAWEFDGQPDYHRDYSGQRLCRARKLGLLRG